jgi:hypothetical protein
MKNFDLNACGVQEMNAAEVAEVNGGFWWIIAEYVYGVAIDQVVGPKATEMYANGQEPWGLGQCYQ